MTLTLVGLGLGAVEDITLRGLNAVKNADTLYLEIYTSALIDSNFEELESFFGKRVLEADRICVEEQNDAILQEARHKNVVLLVAGDPLSFLILRDPPSRLGVTGFCATTHCDLCMRAREVNVEVEIVHNASIINAIGKTGLQLYRFGEVVSIPFFEESWTPNSFYDKVVRNMQANMHTLCLLDIKVKERSIENLMANRMIFEPPRYMTVNVAIDQIFQVDKGRGDIAKETRAFGVARLGSKKEKIVAEGTLQQLLDVDFGTPLHSLVICAPEMHDIEEAYFEYYNYEHVVNGVEESV